MVFWGMGNRMGAISKTSDNRAARFRIITLVINMIEIWFWCPYLCLCVTFRKQSNQHGFQIYQHSVAGFTNIAAELVEFKFSLSNIILKLCGVNESTANCMLVSGITPFQPIYLIYPAICLSGILPVMPAPRRVRKNIFGKEKKIWAQRTFSSPEENVRRGLPPHFQLKLQSVK